MAPGVDLNISEEIWSEYRIIIEQLKRKNRDNTISASKRIEAFIKKDIKEIEKIVK